jgi:hypothetical protein
MEDLRLAFQCPYFACRIEITLRLFVRVAGPTLIALLVWAIAEICICPSGNFPLNDDWIYAVTSRSLAFNGTFELTAQSAVAALPQKFLGFAFIRLFGFSFEVLRCATQIWAAVALFASFCLTYRLGKSLHLGWLSTTLIAANPLYFALANSYMSDTGGMALNTLCSFLFVEYLFEKEPKKGTYLLCLTVATLSTLSRQSNIIVPLSFAFCWLVFRQRSFKSLATAITPLLLSALALALYMYWVLKTVGVLCFYNAEKVYMAQRLPLLAFVELSSCLQYGFYLGLFLLPLLILITPAVLASLHTNHRRFLIALIVELSVLLFAGLEINGRQMPIGENYIYDTGLGPVLFRGATDPGTLPWLRAPQDLWTIVTAASSVGLALLIVYFGLYMKRTLRQFNEGTLTKEDEAALFLVLSLVAYQGLISMQGIFDRYLIVELPLLCAILIRVGCNAKAFAQTAVDKKIESTATWLAWVSIVMLGIYSVAGLHDYFSWNRARQLAVAELTAKKISPSKFDAGYDYNGWLYYTSGEPHPPPTISDARTDNNDWMVAAGKKNGYEVIASYPFQRWFPKGEDTVLLLRKIKTSQLIPHK